MAQFTLKQLMLATACFAIAFAILGSFDYWQGFAPCLMGISAMAGIGILRRRFWDHLGVAFFATMAIGLLAVLR